MRPTLKNNDRAQRFLLLATLYFVQGVPFGLFVQALPVVLRQHGTSFEGIGLSSLLAIPWALKFLWAPWVDEPLFNLPRRKGWILPIHLLTMAALAGLAFLPVLENISLLLAMILGINFLNATQDIATDGLAVDLLPVDERGGGNGLQVGGYRVGMVFGGAGALLVIGEFGWMYGALACVAALGVGILPLLWMREERETERPPRVQSRPLRSFFGNRHRAVALVSLLVLFKFGDAMSTGMLRPMLVDFEFSMADIGVLVGGFGFVFALAGAFGGGIVADKFSRGSALLIAVGLQFCGALLYLPLTVFEPSFQRVALAVATENLLGGVATVVLFTCMMDWARPNHSGADYTVMASVVVMATGAGSIVSGFSVSQFGFTTHFIVSALLTLLGGLAACAIFRREHASFNH